MTSENKTRLDRALVLRGQARSRGEAQTLIEAGQVTVAGLAAAKPSLLVTDNDILQTHGDRCPYVSRGGLKLAAALKSFPISVAGSVALDMGASTGGFSDCLLQSGASQVFAVDVGHEQLSPVLAHESRLHYREGINVRSLTREDFPVLFSVITIDLSFISLTLVLPVISQLIQPGGDVICLVKPQFEVGQSGLGKGGVVRDDACRQTAVQCVREAAVACGFIEYGIIDSPITGIGGNREFLLWLKLAAGKLSA